jgi:uncharacterized protein YerC
LIGGDGRLEKQQTFTDIVRIQTVTNLSQNQKRVVRLLDDGCTQGIIADRMHVSRSFVSQTVRMLESQNLIKKQFPSKYNCFYQLSPELQTRYPKEEMPEFISTRVHNIRRKYRILHQSHPVSLDRRLGFMKSWKMRGAWWHKFWYSGKAGEPRITIDVLPGTIIVYPDAKQSVVAESEREATDRMNVACHNAVQRFIREQGRFGVHIEIDEIGKQIVPIHYGFAMPKDSPYVQGGIQSPDEWVDGSPMDMGNPDQVEYETTNYGKATALSEAIDKVKRVDSLVKEGIREAMPEAMREFTDQFAPLRNEIVSVMSFVQGGMTIQQQLQQLTFLVAQQLKDNHALQDEIVNLKQGRTTTTGFAEPFLRSAYAPTYED